MIGLSVPAYGLLFGFNALLLMLVSAISARLVAVYGAERLLRIGLITNLVGSAATLLVAVTGVPVWLLTLTLPIAVAPLGLVFGNATALALDAAPARVAGLGSAILGLAQFALAGLVSPLVSLGGEGTATPLGIVMVTASVVAMAMFLVGRSRTSILEG
jgi:DHA1 family bicyclomycin/chloramphenicol resistance-like MFS transporter